MPYHFISSLKRSLIVTETDSEEIAFLLCKFCGSGAGQIQAGQQLGAGAAICAGLDTAALCAPPFTREINPRWLRLSTGACWAARYCGHSPPSPGHNCDSNSGSNLPLEFRALWSDATWSRRGRLVWWWWRDETQSGDREEIYLFVNKILQSGHMLKLNLNVK